MARIITDNKWKNFRYENEVPRSVREDDFDYLDEDEGFDGYFRYRGVWYHVSMFERTRIPGWDGVHADSFFSGVVIRVSDDGEQYVVGTYLS